MKPTRLQIGASRLEFLPDTALRTFLNKSWIHLGDALDSPSWLRAMVRRWRMARRGIASGQALSEKTAFEAFHFERGQRLAFADGSLHFIFSEHFFEHLFFDEAMALFRECHRVLAPFGIMRVSVPDSDLRTYEAPESVGFPSRNLSFNDPRKHKTRWNVYQLTEALEQCHFKVVPLRFCDREGNYVVNQPKKIEASPEQELISDMSYLRRPKSLIVDGVKQ